MGKVIADLATSAASATFAVENATSSVDYVLSGTDGSANDHLKTDGSGNLAWVTPAGGVTRASQWRLDTDLGVGNGSTWDYITANLSVATGYGYGSIGADFAEPSSGVFTYPETGTWLITYVVFYAAVTEPNMMHLVISTTINDTDYNHASEVSSSEVRAGYTGSAMCNFLFNVSSVSTHKVKFGLRRALSAGTIFALGDGTKNETSITFLRLGDST